MLQKAAEIIESKGADGFDKAVQLVGSDAACALLICRFRQLYKRQKPTLSESEIILNVMDRLSAKGIMT
jgi:hypothetical protein